MKTRDEDDMNPVSGDWVFDLLPEALVITDGDVILDANPTLGAWTEMEPAKLKGQALRSIISANSIEQVLTAKRKHSKTPLLLEGTGPLQEKWLESLVLTLPPEGRKDIEGWALFLRDVTDRIQLEQMQDSFTEIVANLVKTRETDEVLRLVSDAIRRHGRFARVLVTYLDDDLNDVRYIHSGLSAAEAEWLESEVPFTGAERKQIFQDKYRYGNSYHIPHDNIPWEQLAGVPVLDSGLASYDNWHPDDFLFIPLQRQDGKVLALISVDEPFGGRLPSIETMSAMEKFAELATIALYNAELWEKIQQQAVTDALTGLYNRHFFNEFLTKESSRSNREGKLFTLMMIDLDGFKKINDNYGHLIGDQVLVKVAEVLKECTRTSDVIARFGGDEFVVLLPETSLEEGAVVQGRIEKTLEKSNQQDENNLPNITLSIGVSGGESGDILWLLEAADRKMYENKTQKKPNSSLNP